jgi:hypothetical protein
LIGQPVTQEYLAVNPHLAFATKADDLGVIISYNTRDSTVLTGHNPITAGMTGLVINPITWTRSESLATKEQGLGSFMPDSTGTFIPVPQYADARVDTVNGVLICTTADSSLTTGKGKGIYHIYDYPFCYFNLRQNAWARISRFFGQ